jgi:hypothetical protein
MSLKLKPTWRSAVIVAISAVVLAGCTTPMTRLTPESKKVHLRMDSGFNADNCIWVGEVAGNEGHWYSYLFFPNDVLIEGAMYDIKNRANEIGANTVFVVAPQDFTTSFSIMGSAYICEPLEP